MDSSEYEESDDGSQKASRGRTTQSVATKEASARKSRSAMHQKAREAIRAQYRHHWTNCANEALVSNSAALQKAEFKLIKLKSDYATQMAVLEAQVSELRCSVASLTQQAREPKQHAVDAWSVVEARYFRRVNQEIEQSIDDHLAASAGKKARDRGVDKFCFELSKETKDCMEESLKTEKAAQLTKKRAAPSPKLKKKKKSKQ